MTRPDGSNDHGRHATSDRQDSAWLIRRVLSSSLERVAAAGARRPPGARDREMRMNMRAMSIVGTALVITLTGCAVHALARGESISPYAALLAVGGIAYVVARLALRVADM